ncbi:MAG: hypothetical protein IT186_24150 [Acidobacteria bacterium]|nr:hypothetical protein [Acidobacteriota bacterium]
MTGREERARARAHWVIRRIPLRAEGGTDDLSAFTTPEERLAMMWRLALDAFKVVPDYKREAAPGEVRRACKTRRPRRG